MPSPKRPRKPKQPEIGNLGRLIPESMLKFLSANGVETVRQLGIESVRHIILDILSGKNLRSVTESLTRRRIASLNLAMVSLFLKGATDLDGFVEGLPDMAAEAYANRAYAVPERALAQWILGLTNKAYQNVLRSDLSLVPEYKDVYVEACREVVANHEKEYGGLAGTFLWGKEDEVPKNRTPVDWTFFVYLLNAVGAQTLSIRGSDKSTYGKLFERLVLGSLLSILDFNLVLPPESSSIMPLKESFWLSSRRDDDREADATVIYAPGQGVRFDIGFIGVGNTEITKDKTTRFRRNAQIAGQDHYMATIIIVDRVGERSLVPDLARQLDNGRVVQMSASFWPQAIARMLKEVFAGYDHPLVDMEPAKIEDYLRRKLADAPLETFLKLSESALRDDIDSTKANLSDSGDGEATVSSE